MEGGGAIPVPVWRLKRRNQLGLVLIHTLVRISEGQYLLGKSIKYIYKYYTLHYFLQYHNQVVTDV